MSDDTRHPNDAIRDGLHRAHDGLSHAAQATINRVTELTLPVQVELAAIRQWLELIERRLQNVEVYIEARRDQLGMRAEDPPP